MFKHEACAGAPVVSQHQSPLQLPCQRSKRIAVDRVASLLQMTREAENSRDALVIVLRQ